MNFFISANNLFWLLCFCKQLFFQDFFIPLPLQKTIVHPYYINIKIHLPRQTQQLSSAGWLEQTEVLFSLLPAVITLFFLFL